MVDLYPIPLNHVHVITSERPCNKSDLAQLTPETRKLLTGEIELYLFGDANICLIVK